MIAEELFENEMRVGIYLCTRGSCTMTVNGCQCALRCGDAIIKSPLVVVSEMIRAEDFVIERIVADEIAVFAPMASANFEIFQTLLSNNHFTISLDAAEQSFMLRRRALIAERQAEMAVKGVSEKQLKVLGSMVEMLEQETVLEFANMHLRRGEVVLPGSDKYNNTMVRFVFLMFRHHRQHRDVAFYASALNLSHNRFTRIIKSVSHHTPSEWITFITVNQAKKLLRHTSLSIKDIARELNFPEQFTFRKYFKHNTGLSPTAFRLRHSQSE